MKRDWIKKIFASENKALESVRTSASQSRTELAGIFIQLQLQKKLATNCTSTRQEQRNNIWDEMKKHMNKYAVSRSQRRSMAKDAAKNIWAKLQAAKALAAMPKPDEPLEVTPNAETPVL